MRLFLLFLFISASVYAQDLTTGRRSSYYTFVYKLTNAEAEALYKKQQPTQAFCHSLHTLYPSDSARFQKELPVGHYLEVRTVQDKLQYELISINNMSLHLLNNQRDLIFTISDQEGNEVADAKVKIRNRNVPFNKKDNAYLLQKSNNRGLLSVSVNNHTAFFPIERQLNNTFFVRTGKKILGTFPINHLVSVIVYPIRTVKNLIKGNYISPPGIYYKVKHLVEPKYQKNWTGYLVLNKPMYKPGDTLKLKAFFTNKRGKPISKELDIRLHNYGRNSINLKLGTVSPYRAGGYVFELVLTDSLNLSLDTNPTLQFEFRDKTVQSESFRYEQYELKANQFFARSENNRKEKSATLYLKGTDSNDMPLYDVRTEILIKPDRVESAYNDMLFVADTLWFHKQKLDAVGETKIVLPDSIFPNAALSYKAIVAFINTDNERQTKELSLQFDSKLPAVRFEVKNESVWILPQSLTNTIELTALGINDEELFTKTVSLPYREKINPYIKEYEAGVHSTWEFLEMASYDKLEVFSNRTADSITISISNPRKIPFHYQVFKNRKLMDRGSAGDSKVIFQNKSATRESYTVSVQYIWAGTSKNENYAVNFNDRQLHVSIVHPPLVYPGQTADFTINVTDAFGKPVQQADITALAYTKKFRQTSFNTVPSFPRKQKDRLMFNTFNEGEFEDLDVKKLDWLLWHKTLGLDSLSFYQFLYPTSGRYEFEKPSSDSITQIAPFVVENGLVLLPTVIYIDNTPVFHSAVNTTQPYSFRVHSGNHRVRIRLRDYSISFPIDVKKNHKQIISIDLKNLPADVLKIELSKAEQEKELTSLSKYFILVDRSADQSRAYLSQYDSYFLFNTSGARADSYTELVGPLHPMLTNFFTADSTEINFNYEPFYSYQFLPGLIRQRSLTKPLLRNTLFAPHISPSFSDNVMTKEEIEKRWTIPPTISRPNFMRYPTHYSTCKQSGSLSFTLNSSLTKTTQKHLATFIINLDSPDQYFIYPATTHRFDRFDAAHYELVLLMDDEQYLRSGKFFLQPFGQTIIKFHSDSLHERNSFSEKLYKMLKEWDDKTTYVEQQRMIEMNEVRTFYYSQRNESYPYDGNLVRGIVLSPEDGSPLPGVNVIVKGTVYGTVTDANGEYYINLPPGGILVFSFIGFTTDEVYVGNRSQVNVELTADVTQLSEVVVIGYGAQRKMNMTASISTVQSNLLQGRIAGVQVSNTPGASSRIYLRGVSSLDNGNHPLIVMDGKIIDADEYRKMNPNGITAIEVLKGDVAVGLYGSRASGGVILISSQPGATTQQLLSTPLPEVVPPAMPEGFLPGNSIRKNFRDYAFWKPKLLTDKNGNAKFSATFPDDITGWKVEALAMTSNKQSGAGSSVVQSYKPLLAQIVMPHFLLEGDSANAIGKITNYTSDTLTIARTIEIKNKQVNSLRITNSHIDSLLLYGSADSIRVGYLVNQNDYTDGEIRKIPVYKKGVKDVDGIFVTLRKDTTITLPPQPGVFKIHAQTDVLDVLLNEIETVKTYPYDCNEQLASKLRVLLAEKKIADFRKETFKHADRVKRIIKKLSENQHEEGGWGWWNKSEGLMWITLHVTHSLEFAEKEAFETNYDKAGVLSFIQSKLFQLPLREQILPMQFLAMHNIKIDARPMYDSLVKTDLSVYSRLRLIELMQQSNLSYNKNWLSAYRKETLKGNFYWGEDGTQLFDNDVMATLIAYRILKNEKVGEAELERIRNFFLEKRSRSWRNTYESTSIIETLLPDLIDLSDNKTKPELTFSGEINKVVTLFPYDTIVELNKPLIIRKSGVSPIYLTAYREFWNAEPERSEKDFVVTTFFEDSVTELKAGKPVTLTVELTVKKDAEYVMLNVPIPAGCSYETKSQSWRNGEVHRQYDYHQTTIFSNSLRAGTYRYTISLVPRYSGKYTLNPSRAEWMYYPTVHGQEGMKLITINYE